MRVVAERGARRVGVEALHQVPVGGSVVSRRAAAASRNALATSSAAAMSRRETAGHGSGSGAG